MYCVPVLDLRCGQAVHAVRGDRAAYAPLRSRLAATSQPAAILGGLRGFFPLRQCYIADLDAILAPHSSAQDEPDSASRNPGGHDALIAALLEEFADIEFWVDAQWGQRADLPPYAQARNVRCVIGSESLPDLEALRATRERMAGLAPPLLSLDYRHGRFIGAPELRWDSALWSDAVIAMNLDRVGAGEGPDLALVDSLLTARPTRRVIAAGGVRDARDLAILRARGVWAVLVGTALHLGALTCEELAVCAA
jgi:phosphoribosylformimino-5-aminoimidazole carboxamide ribotide isomerase